MGISFDSYMGLEMSDVTAFAFSQIMLNIHTKKFYTIYISGA
jgi:hypothetical protein